MAPGDWQRGAERSVSASVSLQTERLLLRPWTDSDRVPFAAINSSPAAMRYFPAPLTRDQSDALIDHFENVFASHGFGVWAVERKDTGAFIGCIGLNPIKEPLPHVGDFEIMWRLHPDHWRRGYAAEGSATVLAHATQSLGFPRVWAMTAERNVPSRALMAHLGMKPEGVFEHPRVPEGHVLRPHVLAST